MNRMTTICPVCKQSVVDDNTCKRCQIDFKTNLCGRNGSTSIKDTGDSICISTGAKAVPLPIWLAPILFLIVGAVFTYQGYLGANAILQPQNGWLNFISIFFSITNLAIPAIGIFSIGIGIFIFIILLTPTTLIIRPNENLYFLKEGGKPKSGTTGEFQKVRLEGIATNEDDEWDVHLIQGPRKTTEVGYFGSDRQTALTVAAILAQRLSIDFEEKYSKRQKRK